MVRDIAINNEQDIFLDDANDLALVSGTAQLEQSIAIDVLDETRNLVGNGITASNISLLEQRIREGLEEDPQVGEIRTVEVAEFDRRSGSVTVDVGLFKDPDFTLEL